MNSLVLEYHSLDSTLRPYREEIEERDLIASLIMQAFIDKSPGVCGGRARIRDTRVPVWTIIELHNLGMPDSTILENYPSLTQLDLKAAQYYYHFNLYEIDNDIDEQDQ